MFILKSSYLIGIQGNIAFGISCFQAKKTENLKHSPSFRLVLIRKFNTTFVGTGVLDCPQQKNFGRELVVPADLWYNGTNKKPSSGRKVARVA